MYNVNHIAMDLICKWTHVLRMSDAHIRKGSLWINSKRQK